MPLLFKDYTELVLKEYEEKRNANLLSRLLMQPTTANIRQDCLNVYNDRMNKGQNVEENILTAFFGVPPAGKNFGYVIARFPPDKFRPFQKFIKREIKNPSLATVELLAWLIDFNPRPLEYAQKFYGITTNTNSPGDPLADNHEEKSEQSQAESDLEEIPPSEEIKITESLSPNTIENTAIKAKDYIGASNEKDRRKRRLKIAVTTSIVLATLLGGGYLTKQYLSSTKTGCMYWAGDHYEQIDCDANINNKILLNEDRLKNFKKITRPDTLTTWSIGKVYYLKNNGALEYFTAAGNHPVFVTRYLRKLSAYMYEIYVRKNSVNLDTSAKSQTTNLTNR